MFKKYKYVINNNNYLMVYHNKMDDVIDIKYFKNLEEIFDYIVYGFADVQLSDNENDAIPSDETDGTILSDDIDVDLIQIFELGNNIPEITIQQNTDIDDFTQFFMKEIPEYFKNSIFFKWLKVNNLIFENEL